MIGGPKSAMRILIVSPYFPPQAAVASLRVHSFASAWAEAGADVTVLTTVKRADQSAWPIPAQGFRVAEIPFRPPRILEPARRAYKSDQAKAPSGEPAVKAREIVVRRLRRIREDRGIFASVRMPDLTDFWVRPAVRWAAGEGPWDVVFSSAGPYTAHLVALAIRRSRRASVWTADFRDLWVGNHLHRGLFPFTMREQALETQCLAAADLVVTVSDPLADALREKGGKRTLVIFNGFEPIETADLPSEPIFPADGTVRIVFTGTLYEAGQDPGPLLQAFAALRDRDVEAARRLRLVVAGASHEYWRHAAARHGVEEVVDARGIVDRADARRLQRDADALLLVDFESAARGALTTKLFEYLGAAAPIVVVGGGPDTSIASLLEPTGRARHLGRDRAAIETLLADLAHGRQILPGPPNLEEIEQYTRARQARRLLSAIEETVDARGAS